MPETFRSAGRPWRDPVPPRVWKREAAITDGLELLAAALSSWVRMFWPVRLAALQPRPGRARLVIRAGPSVRPGDHAEAA